MGWVLIRDAPGTTGRVIETIQIGIIATVIASILSLPVAFLAAKNMSPHWSLRAKSCWFRSAGHLISS